MSLIVFRADGGSSIGAGHVMRCMSLAEQFQANGWRVGFAASGESFDSVAALAGSSLEKLKLPDEDNLPLHLQKRWSDGADILVADHYGLGAEFERACRPWTHRIVALDDLADRSHDADVLVDASRQPEAYRQLVPAQCAVLAGPRYALVHPKFLKLRQQSLGRRDGRAVRRVLLSFGQMDVPNATLCALDALEAEGFEGDIDIAIGSAAPNLQALKRRAVGRVHLHIDTDDMAPLMAAADLAVGAGGGTAWERCCLGLPSILVEIAQNQRETIAFVLASGAGMAAGAADGELTTRVRDRVRELLNNADGRKAIGERGAKLVDGRGAARVLFRAIGGVAARDGAFVVLRPAEVDDEEWLLELQREPETRRFANDASAPTEESHRRWFAATLADPARRLFIIEHGGKRAGMLRLDQGLEAVRVSIAISPASYRLAIGSAALVLASRAIPGRALEAEIFPENAASLALFSAAGYRQVSAQLFRREPS